MTKEICVLEGARSRFPLEDSPDAPNRMATYLAKSLRILRMKQLIERTQLSRATVYLRMKDDPTFPGKIKLGARSIGFLECEVDAWIAARANARAVESVR